MRLHKKAKTLDEMQALIADEMRAFLSQYATAGITKAEAARRLNRDRKEVHRLVKRYGVTWEYHKPAPKKRTSSRVVLTPAAQEAYLSKQEQADFVTLKGAGFTTREALTSIKRTDLMEDAHPRQETTREGA